VRIIAATNANLEKGIAEGRFRLDLYYRLNVFPVVLPPLRSRKGDILLLADHFIRMYATRTSRKTEGIAPDALSRMMDYAWPGNVRELQNVIERSVLMTNEPILREVYFMSTTSLPLRDGSRRDHPRPP
jgi:transcriptional regulator with PAS, ATPase and Fis domain